MSKGHIPPQQGNENSGRFRKGLSGNPRGRPRTIKPEASDDSRFGELPTDRALREMLEKQVTVKTADGARTMAWSEALLNKYSALAASGNRLALEYMIENKRQFEREAAQEAQETSKGLERVKAFKQDAWDRAHGDSIAQAKIFPHPADIVFNRKTNLYELHGPVDEEERAMWRRIGAVRLWFLLQSAQFCRRAPGQPPKTSCAWLIMAWLIDSQMPPSFQWSHERAMELYLQYDRMSKARTRKEASRLVNAAQSSTEFLPQSQSGKVNPVLMYVADVLNKIARKAQKITFDIP